MQLRAERVPDERPPLLRHLPHRRQTQGVQGKKDAFASAIPFSVAEFDTKYGFNIYKETNRNLVSKHNKVIHKSWPILLLVYLSFESLLVALFMIFHNTEVSKIAAQSGLLKEMCGMLQGRSDVQRGAQDGLRLCRAARPPNHHAHRPLCRRPHAKATGTNESRQGPL